MATTSLLHTSLVLPIVRFFQVAHCCLALLVKQRLKKVGYAFLLLLVAPTSASSRVIDNFESGDFFMETVMNEVGPSVHQSVIPSSVIAGDRDVWTVGHDGDGSQTILETSSEDDGVVLTSNISGSIYWVSFQYDGPGINAFSLDADLTSQGHDAFLVNLTDISLSNPSEIGIEVRSNVGEATEALAYLESSITTEETLRFPFSAFSYDVGTLDFQNVDSIIVIAYLGSASSVTITNIETGTIPEPSSLALVAFCLLILPLRRQPTDKLCIEQCK